MFCPSCSGEFRQGVTYCPDCNLPLVDLPAAAGGVAPGLEPILRSNFPDEVSALAAKLRDAGLPYVEQSGTALALFEGGRLFGGYRADDYEGRIWVLATQVEQVREMISTPAKADDEPAEEWPAAEEGESLDDYEDRVNRPPR